MGRMGLGEAKAGLEQVKSPPVCFCFPEDAANSFLETLGNLCLRCVAVTDAQGIIRFTNPACNLVFGFEPREVMGRHFREFYAEPAALDQMLAECRAKGQVENWPIKVFSP